MKGLFRGTLLAVCLAAAGSAAMAPQGALFDGSDRTPPKKTSQLVRENGAPAPEPGSLRSIDMRYWIVVSADSREARTRLAGLGFAFSVGSGGVEGVVDSETLGAIKKAGFSISEQTPMNTHFHPEDFPSSDSEYHNVEESNAALQGVAASMSDAATVFSIGSSVQGRPIMALRLHTPSKDKKPKPGALFMGVHHAREHLSAEVPLLIAQWIADNRDKPEVRELLENRDIYFIPVVNPDGAEYDIASGSYRWHRKNMADNGDGTVGVDLNRNYGYGWGGPGASDRPGADTYRGPSAFSEPESQAVAGFMSGNPDIKVAVSYHSHGSLILWPWSNAYEPISDSRARAAFEAMGQKMEGMSGYRAQQSSDLYASSGDTCDWAWAEMGAFCFTFELPGSSFYPGSGMIQTAFKQNLQPALYLIGLADDPYRAADGAAVASLPKKKEEEREGKAPAKKAAAKAAAKK